MQAWIIANMRNLICWVQTYFPGMDDAEAARVANAIRDRRNDDRNAPAWGTNWAGWLNDLPTDWLIEMSDDETND